jgi:protease-4
MSAPGKIRKIFRGLGSGINWALKILQLLILVVVIGIYAVALTNTQAPLPESAALIVEPSGMLVEQLSGDSFDRVLAELQGTSRPETLVKDVVDSLRMAADDDRIKAVVMRLEHLAGGGLSKLQVIARAMDEFKESGKPLLVMGGSYSQAQYYLASHADEIYMHDLGLVYIDGFSYYRTYLHDVIEKLQVDVNVFRVGEYKSFVEPYLRDDMSVEDKLAAKQWLEGLWNAYTTDIERARNFSAGTIQDYTDNLVNWLRESKGDAAASALSAGLIDGLMSHQEFENHVIGLVGESADHAGSYEGVDI